MNKDLFSGHAGIYAAFRPTYPEDLYEFIFEFVPRKDRAWDCGTGNGQVAQRLSQDFQQVFATDLSEKQIAQAPATSNIFYSVTPAEQTLFRENTFDLITVGQALHWFDTAKFYAEVRRVAKADAVVALWGYANIIVSPGLDPIISHFYSDVVGKYWDNARRLVENEYRDMPFPFERIPSPRFFIEQKWTLDQLCGYLESWSATQRYIKENKENPVHALKEKLRVRWGTNERNTVKFPLFLLLGRI